MKIILILLAILFPFTVLAAGMQVSPDKLEFVLDGKKQTQSLVVANPSSDVELFEISADDYDREIKINPASFTLEAGGRKKIEVTVESAGLPDGVITTALSIIGRPLASSRVQVNTGAKISITIKRGTTSHNNLAIAAAIVLIVAGVITYFWKKQKLRPT